MRRRTESRFLKHLHPLPKKWADEGCSTANAKYKLRWVRVPLKAKKNYCEIYIVMEDVMPQFRKQAFPVHVKIVLIIFESPRSILKSRESHDWHNQEMRPFMSVCYTIKSVELI